ncbi:MAG: flagellin, partial [Phycisphaeraceae bacterium]
VAASINSFKSVTGVSAAVSATTSNTSQLILKSTDYGSDQFVSVKVTGGASAVEGSGIYQLSSTDENLLSTSSQTTFANATTAVRDEGQDIGAIINGITAVAKGRTASIATDFLDVSVELNTSGAQTLATVDAFTITGGGAVFNLGPNVDITNQVSIGIANVAARNLGSIGTGFLDDLGAGKSANVVTGDLGSGQEIVNKAINQVSLLRGRLGAFQKNVIGATIRSLSVALENTSAAESLIRDTDFAAETAELTRSQILVNAATNVLAIANAQPQSVLALLA